MEDNKLAPRFSRFQNVVLCSITLIFVLFIGLFIPNKYRFMGVIVFLLGLPLIGITVVSTAKKLSVLHCLNVWISIISTAILFLLVPAIMTISYFSHLNDYRTSIPSDNCIQFRINANVKKTGGSGNVGNEWSYKHAINSNQFKSGEIIELNIKNPFTITSTITENDDINDVGTTTSGEYSFSVFGNYSEEIVITNSVRVDERGGRRNSGAYALFSVEYTINRVLPEDYSFFDVYFFTESQTENSFLWGVLFLGLGSLLFIAILFYAYKKRMIKIESERKAEEERKFQAEKRAFIAYLDGRSLRDVAGVPESIRYENGIPVDNNNAEYGSFTVYLSHNGKCYHGQKGCSSAYLPTHFFKAKQHYKPCSKCCYRYYDIPEWHEKYMSLKVSAQKFGIEE